MGQRRDKLSGRMSTLTRRLLLQGLAATAASQSLAQSIRRAGTLAAAPPPSEYNVLRFGAKGNGETKDTAAIQHAIDACARDGGGRVVLPPGHIFLSGSLRLRDHVELCLAPGSALKASPDRDDFRQLGALILAEHVTGASIAGGGAIDGNFPAFLTARTREGYTVTQPFLGPYDPLYDKPGRDWPDGRPRMVLPVGCNGFRMRDITIRNAPTWTVHLLGCADVHISGVTIANDPEVPNCDGIDIDHCRQVRISDCNITAGDDCLVLKASRNFREFGPCEDVVITNCTMESSSAAIKVEAEGPDAIRRITATGCTVNRSNRGIAVNNRDGAVCEDMVFADMTIGTELRPPMWWGAGEPVYVTSSARTRGGAAGVVRNLQFSNLVCRGENGIFLEGTSAAPLKDIRFRDIDVTIAKTSTIPGGYYDTRPGDNGQGIRRQDIAGVFGDYCDDLSLDGIHVRWSGPPQPYYGSALALRHCRSQQVSEFQGVAGRPGIPDQSVDK